MFGGLVSLPSDSAFTTILITTLIPSSSVHSSLLSILRPCSPSLPPLSEGLKQCDEHSAQGCVLQRKVAAGFVLCPHLHRCALTHHRPLQCTLANSACLTKASCHKPVGLFATECVEEKQRWPCLKSDLPRLILKHIL